MTNADLVAEARNNLRPRVPEWLDDDEHPETAFRWTWADSVASIALVVWLGWEACHYLGWIGQGPIEGVRTAGLIAFGCALASFVRFSEWQKSRTFWQQQFREAVPHAFESGIRHERLRLALRELSEAEDLDGPLPRTNATGPTPGT